MSTKAYVELDYTEEEAKKFRLLSVKLLRNYPKVNSLIESKLNYRPPYSDYMFTDYDPIYNSLANVDSLERVVFDRKQRNSLPSIDAPHPLFFPDYEHLMKAGIPMIEFAIGSQEQIIENWSFWGRSFAKFGKWISNKLDWIENHPKTTIGLIFLTAIILEELGWGYLINLLKELF